MPYSGADVQKGFLGWVVMKGPGTTTTETQIPFLSLSDPDPSNDAYLPLVTSAAFPVNVVRGKATPAVGINTVAKASWFTAAMLNSLIVTPDTNYDTGAYDMMIVREGTKKVGEARCGRIQIAHAAAGGPLSVSLGFVAKTFAATTVFASTTATVDAGDVIHASNIDFGTTATADLVDSFSLEIVRPQAYRFFSDASSYDPTGVSSGQISGSLTLVQSAKAATIPSTSITIRVKSGAPGSTTVLATFTLKLNQDIKARESSVGFEMIQRRYSLIDIAGGAPVAIA